MPSRQQIAEKIRTLCAENLQCFLWHVATSEKQLFCHSPEKAAHKYVDEIDARVFVNVVAFFIKFLFYPGWGANLGFHLLSHALPLRSSGSPEFSIFSLA